jgi:hypothetical protein
VCENIAPWAMLPESHKSALSDTTVCGIASLFTHFTVSPVVIAMIWGENADFVILTVTVFGVVVCGIDVPVVVFGAGGTADGTFAAGAGGLAGGTLTGGFEAAQPAPRKAMDAAAARVNENERCVIMRFHV